MTTILTNKLIPCGQKCCRMQNSKGGCLEMKRSTEKTQNSIRQHPECVLQGDAEILNQFWWLD